ncbi:AI-2E family transporter [Crocosphaera sp. XPORK-15E]|uniref:AI-2E family transporter n=1 Tax=Crocosphaera sp. XPORK-15E TaxID=3110247 RepID=UPI002B213A4A|nr:AI-2E family transporter [Crocosphaera sp. XPORK-15E]MEA5535212.1 AI-2E family transporter [Crocosphaera sp. XPORK-15E]
MKFSQWLGFIVLVISLYILWQIRQLLLLLFTAVIIANSLNHAVQRFQKWGISRSYAVLLAMSLLIATLTAFIWIIIPPFAEQLPELLKLVPQGIDQLIITLKEFISRLDPELIQSLPTTDQFLQQLQPLVQQIAGQGLNVFYMTLGIPLTILLLLALSLMLLANPQAYRQGFMRLFPSFYRNKIDLVLTECDEALQGWLLGILFNMTIIAILSFIGLSIFGIRLSLAQAMLAGLLTFIPNIGPALSVIPPMAIALLEAPWKSLAVLILYIGIQQIEGNILTPLVMAHRVSLLPAMTLLSQVFFATIFGFLGLFLALPLAVVSQVWLKEVLIKDILDQWETEPKILNNETEYLPLNSIEDETETKELE